MFSEMQSEILIDEPSVGTPLSTPPAPLQTPPGSPVSDNWIPYGRQSITKEDIEAVVGILRSSYLTQGPTVEDFERRVAAYTNARHGVAVNSATSALHIACLAAGLKSGDYLWTVPNSFVASANCGLYCGATVDFVDIDPQTYNMSVADLARKLSVAERERRLPKVLIPVHFAGQSCEMAAISELAKQYGITVIEDASHGIGGTYRGTKIGACEFSDMAVFSFHPVKIITSGEGGLVTTNNTELYNRLVRLRSHGITRDPRFLREPLDGPWAYEQLDLGFNYRLTDVQASLGLSQMVRIDEFVRRRTYLVERYNKGLRDLPLTLPTKIQDANPAWHLYVIRLQLEKLRRSRKEIYAELKDRNIGTNVHYIPIYWQPYYRDLGFKPGLCPEAEAYYSGALSIPLYFELSDQEQDYVIANIRSVLTSS